MWLIVFLSVSFCVLLKSLFFNKKQNLPPGPPMVPVLGNLIWLTRKISDIEFILRDLRAKYGPVVTLHIGPRPVIFISDHSLAHQALVQNGAAFADRPPASEVGKIITCNQHNINSAGYGPLWRLFRRNLVSEILHPSRVKSFTSGREWVLSLLIEKFRSESEAGDGTVPVLEGFQDAMFCLLLLMCFGQKLDEKLVREIEAGQRGLILSFPRFNVFAFFPKVGKILFRKRWNELLEIRRRQEELLVPLIRARVEHQKKQGQDDSKLEANGVFSFCYVDSLLGLELPDEGGRKLTEREIVTLCSEFLNGGTDTTSTALQWIFANLVKNQEIQARLFEEINGGVKEGSINEEDLQKMPYLRAVIMESLRRHPPAHFVLPHRVSEDVSLDGYVIPKNASVNFTVADMGWDGKMWKDPLEFKPERFLEGEEVDITGSREIKMMPFGVGRRICPGWNLAMMHLEFFVANLVREFEWRKKDGEEIDLSEKQAFTIIMKNPLRAVLVPRTK